MKYALVTGASRGLGRAIAVRLAQLGYNILINYAGNTAAAEETLRLVREAGTDGELWCFDVADREKATSTIQAWQEAHEDEYIEVCVNNAGIRRDGVMALMPFEDYTRVIDITLQGFFNVTQPLLPAMQFHKFGRIINICETMSVLEGEELKDVMNSHSSLDVWRKAIQGSC